MDLGVMINQASIFWYVYSLQIASECAGLFVSSKLYDFDVCLQQC